MEIDDMIRVLQAHKEGKKIESKWNRNPKNTDWELMKWHLCDNPTWDFGYYDYRVAPEPPKPREWNVIVNDEGNINWGFKYDPRFYGGVRVREVIGASSGNPTVASDTASSIP